MRPQPHGGALLPGGQLGNRGGGRPTNLVRELALECFERRLPRLDAIAGDELTKKGRRVPVPINEQRLAIVSLGQLGGMAQKIEVEGSPAGFVVGVLRGPEAAKAGQVTLPEGGSDAPPTP